MYNIIEMEDLTDEELMLIFKGGNNNAFDMLFDKYRNRIFRYVYNLFGGNTELSEDIVQEVFIKMVTGKDTYNPQLKFSTWLYSITRNLCINRMKSRSFRNDRSTYPLDAVYETVLSKQQGATSNIEKAELGEVIERAVAELPAKYKEVFILHELNGLPYDEIARILETNEDTIRTRFHRSRNLLKEKIRPYWEG